MESHPFVFQVRGVGQGSGFARAAEELLDVIGDRRVKVSYCENTAPAVIGVLEGCSEQEAGELIGDLRRLSVAHPMLRVCLGGYGHELPPTVLEHGRFSLFGEAYRSFCRA